ncbi:MFS transporter [Acidocella sp. MX-AZ03]|nr:MFS transporter [Acidocella sp. MX-AZ03]WBO61214.1 MFS transporter [Acidocella sp. MX-AZ03]
MALDLLPQFAAGAVAFGLVWWLVPDTRGPHPARFDRRGFLLSGLALVCLLTMAELFSRARIPWREVAALGFAGGVLLAAALLHMRNHAAPLLDLSVLRVKSFAVTILGGSLFRMSVGAVPFLLPVMFQIGLGYDAFTAGTLLMAVFAGNLLIKPATTPILRRFGFRNVLIFNGLLNALALACCAGLGRFMPLPVICAILFLGGATRSMQFTALNTIAFADVPQARMAGANTLFSTAAQLAMGLGVAVGASPGGWARRWRRRPRPGRSASPSWWWRCWRCSGCWIASPCRAGWGRMSAREKTEGSSRWVWRFCGQVAYRNLVL